MKKVLAFAVIFNMHSFESHITTINTYRVTIKNTTKQEALVQFVSTQRPLVTNVVKIDNNLYQCVQSYTQQGRIEVPANESRYVLLTTIGKQMPAEFAYTASSSEIRQIYLRQSETKIKI